MIFLFFLFYPTFTIHKTIDEIDVVTITKFETEFSIGKKICPLSIIHNIRLPFLPGTVYKEFRYLTKSSSQA